MAHDWSADFADIHGHDVADIGENNGILFSGARGRARSSSNCAAAEGSPLEITAEHRRIHGEVRRPEAGGIATGRGKPYSGGLRTSGRSTPRHRPEVSGGQLCPCAAAPSPRLPFQWPTRDTSRQRRRAGRERSWRPSKEEGVASETDETFSEAEEEKLRTLPFVSNSAPPRAPAYYAFCAAGRRSRVIETSSTPARSGLALHMTGAQKTAAKRLRRVFFEWE